jgi:hypothetical protein
MKSGGNSTNSVITGVEMGARASRLEAGSLDWSLDKKENQIAERERAPTINKDRVDEPR